MIVVIKLAAQESRVNCLSRYEFWQTYNNVHTKISPKTIVGIILQHHGRLATLISTAGANDTLAITWIEWTKAEQHCSVLIRAMASALSQQSGLLSFREKGVSFT